MKDKIFFLNILTLLIFCAFPLHAQEPIGSGEVIHNSITIPRMHVHNSTDSVIRLSTCDPSKPDLPCEVLVTSGMSSGPRDLRNVSLNSDRSATLTCSYIFRNALGQENARLQQNVGVTFHTSQNSTPVTLRWGNLGGTSAVGLTRWVWTSGPTPSPSWGVRTTGQANVVSSGMVEYGIPTPWGTIVFYQYTVSVRLWINSSGWGCS